MKTRILHTRFWQDDFVNTLSQKEKLIFIYLITNDRVSLTGMYELPDKYIKMDLEITQKELDTAKNRLKDKIIFHKGWIKIINHDKYNSYTGESIDKAKEKELQSVPKDLREGRPTPPPRVDPRVDTSVDPPNNHKSKTINHKPIIINKDITRFKEVWSKIYGKELQGSKAYVEAPLKRLITGYGVKDVCGLLYWAEQNRKDNKYIAVIRHPKDLEDKWNSLINQYKKGKDGKSKGVIC